MLLLNSGRVPPILLVEDNPDDELLTLLAFEKNSVANPIIVARDGEEALRRLDECDTLPGLVLLDLKLPVLNGHEVLRAIRGKEHTHHLPVVILTTSLEPSDVTLAYREGAQSYVRKPLNFDQFVDSIGLISRYWLQLNYPALIDAPSTPSPAPQEATD